MSNYIDVRHAFDPELRQAQQEFDSYMAASPEARSEPVDPITFDESPVYEDMGVVELARLMGEADKRNDVTSTEHISDVLFEKVDDFAETRNLSPEARTALVNRLFKVSGIEEAEQVKLPELEEEPVPKPKMPKRPKPTPPSTPPASPAAAAVELPIASPEVPAVDVPIATDESGGAPVSPESQPAKPVKRRSRRIKNPIGWSRNSVG